MALMYSISSWPVGVRVGDRVRARTFIQHKGEVIIQCIHTLLHTYIMVHTVLHMLHMVILTLTLTLTLTVLHLLHMVILP